MGIFVSRTSDQIGFYTSMRIDETRYSAARMYTAQLDVTTYFWVFSHVQVIVWDELDPTLYSDAFEYKTLGFGDKTLYDASRNARDFVRKALQ
jgi:hypothetical protein